ncbi:MAG: FkbM family methyltransferase [Eubacteriales bacterium]|nr:FkbM family methyltransferase [Eubacteriales bacterium]
MGMIPDFVTETTDLWTVLQQETRPIVLYGMGDGAQKILDACAEKRIAIQGIFASDEFVRGHSFAGYLVRKRSELEAELGDFVCLISFASSRPEVMALFDDLDRTHTTYAPDVPVAEGKLFDWTFLEQNGSKLQRVYDKLADERSRQVFAATVNFKLSGKLHWLRDYTQERETAWTDYLCPSKDEHYVDLGAYNGDTIRELLAHTDGKYASITALEPDRKTFKKLKKYAEKEVPSARLFQAGSWSEPGELLFASKGGRNSTLLPVRHAISHDQRTAVVAVESVDHVMQGRDCTLLKMDVEGAERETLLGARGTIRRCRPRMELAAYHRSEDLFELPLLLWELCPDAQIALLHHPYVPAWETNFYITFPGTSGKSKPDALY